MPAAPPGRGPTVGPAVEFSGVTTVLDDTPILLRLGLRLEPGAITVLMGPSGSGKTTLVRHLAGLFPPNAGRISVGDDDVWTAGEPGLRRIRRGMSVLLGGSSLFDASLFASLSAYDNVGYGLGERGIPKSDQEALIMRRLREMRLDDRPTAMPSELPAHARKRLALARALAVEAPLVVLDEIETSLDAAHTPRVIAALREQHERTGATMLVTTHDVALARTLGDTLAVLCNGRIVATGPAAELLRGVETGDEFDRRFRLSDFMGPPRLSDAEAALGTDGDRRRVFEIDTRAIVFAVAAVALVTTWVLILLLR
ncbi:ABC transporter ATP-binding protein [Pseudonocardia sp. KRD291]|uniref:ABC transporter ATP-binding protein n=1 Tax=Pseudonocardia sp. KRD291 TaxID=2792007 RepID=UPI001C49DD3E|nr:ATP-binding cassette domain-containing protein [Pseudonocardia sp. KRD291]MBW0101174.1 ATP-binding cassette domain-containing protein [Pseudonocardia sp. KRD291]